MEANYTFDSKEIQNITPAQCFELIAWLFIRLHSNGDAKNSDVSNITFGFDDINIDVPQHLTKYFKPI